MFNLFFPKAKATQPARPVAKQEVVAVETEEVEETVEEIEAVNLADFQQMLVDAVSAAIAPVKAELATLREQVEGYKAALSSTAAPAAKLPEPTAQLEPASAAGLVDDFTRMAMEKRAKK